MGADDFYQLWNLQHFALNESTVAAGFVEIRSGNRGNERS